MQLEIVGLEEHKKINMKLLLHSCCAGCAAYIINKLKQEYNIVVYFYNPNIFPHAEFNIRMNEVKQYTNEQQVNFVLENGDYEQWKEKVSGLENEPEKGKRCQICIKTRLEQTAKFAKQNGFTHFATTLTISPHKDAEFISKIGNELAEKYNLIFLDEIWRKNNGFLESCKLSEKLHFYRQNYCGCELSKMACENKKMQKIIK